MKNRFLNRYAKFNSLSIEEAKLCIREQIEEVLLDWMRKGGDDSWDAENLACVFAFDFLPCVCDNGILEIEGAKYRISLD